MTHHQKLIIASLAGVAILIFVFLGCLAFFLIQPPAAESQPALAAAAQPATPVPTGIASPIATPLPTATVPPTETPLPTPTSTRVVTQTVLPTPEPTRHNCINDINDFEASGVLTNEQVQTYLQGVIPLSHLDNCLGIRYIDQFVAVHATPAAGKFIPLFRQISVYRIGQQSQTAAALLETLTHEVGHNVHFNMRIDKWDLAVRWRELYVASEGPFAETGLGFVSDYARANHFEDFAETYRAYILEPGLLKAANPEKYEFMWQEVFAGREY